MERKRYIRAKRRCQSKKEKKEVERKEGYHSMVPGTRMKSILNAAAMRRAYANVTSAR